MSGRPTLVRRRSGARDLKEAARRKALPARGKQRMEQAAPARQDVVREREAQRYADGFMREAPRTGRAMENVAGGGRPLPEDLRAAHEERTGTDLGAVRVHDDAASMEAAGTLGARGYQEGEAIRLGPSAPRSGPAREKLIAHEVAHVAQARRDGAAGGAPRLDPEPTLMPSVPAPEVFRSDFGVSLTLYFSQGSFLLGASGLRALNRVQQQLRAMPDAVVSIDGFASAEGTDEFNLRLSENRRQTVRALLLAGLGFAPDVSGTGHGESQSQETDVDPAERERFRARHRRVEITIVSPALASAPSPEPDEPAVPPVITAPRIPFRPETDQERLDRILRMPVITPEPTTFSVCGVWRDSTRRWFDRRLRDLGVGDGIRGRLVDLGVGAVERLPFTAVEEALKAGEVGGTERRAIMSALRAACRQEVRR
ncbi:DUF4157 domain-containing protein [Nitratireductor sp. XY-223]|uniref:eCIS core domain-containing protein n=1 Tax=Nitratireductor sp. XY-223 TaxID=2561926 RepID=UPI0010AA9306|nr:DUF4157 domain-containing protein [Nitratireductor sp. XY-223]